MTYLRGGITVRAWPPEIIPESQTTKGILQRILTSTRWDPLWQYSRNVPSAVLDMAKAIGWRAPLIAEVDKGRVLQLWTRNPGLVALMAHSLPDRIDDLRSITKTALIGKDRDILGPIGYPACNAFVKLLGKVQPECRYPSYFRGLRTAWRDQGKRKLMLHLKAVNHDVCCVLGQPREMINHALLERASESLPGHGDVEYAIRLLQGEWRLSRRAGPWPYGHIGYPTIYTAVDRLRVERLSAVPFGPPPVDGTPTIVPIRTTRQLFEEGRRQRNCSFSLRDQILSGNSYFYRVMRPKCRCTMVLDRQGEYWAMSALQAAQNNPPSIQAVEEVAIWLRDAFPMTEPAKLDIRASRGNGDWDEDRFETSAPADDRDEPGWDFPEDLGDIPW